MTLTSVLWKEKFGPYGKSSFPGSCSGNNIKELLEYFKPKKVLDPMEGSGTCRDVCRELNIVYDGFDIIRGGNIFEMKFNKDYDFIHWHPPYFRINREGYLKLAPSEDNLAFPKNPIEYLEKLFKCFEILYDDALVENGILAILCGIRQEKGSFLLDMAHELRKRYEKAFFFEIIKVQGGIDKKVLSGRMKNTKMRGYRVAGKYTLFGNPFIPIMHEKYVLFRKTGDEKI